MDIRLIWLGKEEMFVGPLFAERFVGVVYKFILDANIGNDVFFVDITKGKQLIYTSRFNKKLELHMKLDEIKPESALEQVFTRISRYHSDSNEWTHSNELEKHGLNVPMRQLIEELGVVHSEMALETNIQGRAEKFIEPLTKYPNQTNNYE